jgi:glycosyltransferase involved in cell wall biosynthesis
VLETLDKVAGVSKYILCQTDEFYSYWEKHIPWAQGKIRLLPPMVPEFDQRREPPTAIKRICYAGKFAPLWGISEMFEAFASLRETHPEIELHIFGDKIHNPPELPDFQSTVLSHLENTAGLVWHRGLSRAEVLVHMTGMDLGWAWRSPELEDKTLELSTKILEYGACGLPVVLYRNSINEKLLGPDYPLFVNTRDELLSLFAQILKSPDILRIASARARSASEQYTINRIRDKYIRPLLASPSQPRIMGGRTTQSSILVAGHDLKFISKLCQEFSKHGHDILVDKWGGRTQHDTRVSQELLGKADIIICEWCLGNAVWYSRNKWPEQKLVIRFHLQERDTVFPKKVAMENVDKMIFVGPHIMREATRRFKWGAWVDGKLVLIPNYVDVGAFNLPKIGAAQFNLGICGFVPSRKRLDLAVDILEKLTQVDNRFRLYAKGKMPQEYLWMLGRRKEMRYYDKVMHRIGTSDLLRDAVQFDGWGDDMPEWYRKIGFILSVSDFESFHLSVPEGAASKAIPLILKWEGAEEIYPGDWTYHTVDEIANAILDMVQSGRFDETAVIRYDYVKQNFDIERIAQAWLELIEADYNSINQFATSIP